MKPLPQYPRLVCVESAYASRGDPVGSAANREFLREALLDSLHRGEAPYASHAYLPNVLDDNDASQRSVGMEAGHAWAKTASLIAIYLREPAERISKGVVERLARVAPTQDMTPIVVRVAEGPMVFGERREFREWLVVGRSVDLDGCFLSCVPAEPRAGDRDDCKVLFLSRGMALAEAMRRHDAADAPREPRRKLTQPYTLEDVLQWLQWAREDCFNDDGRGHVDSAIEELERIAALHYPSCNPPAKARSEQENP